MTDQDWDQLKHFTRDDAWGDSSKMNFQLIWLLDCYREYIDRPIYVTCGTQGKHSPRSWHYSGNAVDVIIDKKDTTRMDLILAAFRFPFSGFGIYPYVLHTECSEPIGFHFDSRPVSSLPRGITQAQWMGIKQKDGSNKYVEMNKSNFLTYGII